MNVTSFPSLRSAGLLVSLALALTAGPARGQDAAAASVMAKQSVTTDAFPRFESFIKISGQAPSVTGSDSAYARRFQLPTSGAYGIEAMHIAKDLNPETSMEFDGRALTGAEDYLAALKFTKNEVGSFDMGYKSFRTFYDAIGGFFPRNSFFKQLGTSELHTDRSKFWANLKIARPDKPSFELSYTNERRDGRKDTTIWGNTDYTGIPINTVGSLNLYTAARSLIPSYIDLDEKQQNLVASMKHTIGNTQVELEVASNKTNSLDSRFVNRYPDELKPYPAIPTIPNSVVPPNLANNPISGFDKQKIDANVMTYTGKFETKATDQLTFFGGLSYQDASADIGGDRQMTITINTAMGFVRAVGGYIPPGGRPPYSYTTLSGETKEKILTGNFGFTFKPQNDLIMSLAIKGENEDMKGHNHVVYINNAIVQATGVVTPIMVDAPNVSSRNEDSWVPEFTIRYTGIKDLSLYADLDYRSTPGKQAGTSIGVGANAVPSVVASAENTRLNHGHYKVGANWTVNQMVSLRGEFYLKDHQNSYTGYGLSTGSNFILGYNYQGVKLTAIVKPLNTLTFTTRLVAQSGSMDTTTDYGTNYDSLASKNRIISETIDWNPDKNVYVQGNVNVVFATMSTAYPQAGNPANNLLRNSDSNYINGSIVTGFTVDKNTDLHLEYTFYRADNYKPGNNIYVFYGAGATEYTVAAEFSRKFSNKLIGHVKVGYFDSKNDTTGGNTNFKGPMGYVSLDYAL